MSKGELVKLYIERMELIVRILPKMALASKPSVTTKDWGILDPSDNKKALLSHRESTQEYLDTSVGYLRKMLPFYDKGS